MGRLTPARSLGGAAVALVLLAGTACSDDDGDDAVVVDADTYGVYRFDDDGTPGDLDDAILARLGAFGFDAADIRTTNHAIGDEPPFGTVEVGIRSDEGGELAVAAAESLERQGVLRFRPILSTHPADAPTTPRDQDAANKVVDLPEQHTDTGPIVAVHRLGRTGAGGDDIVESATARQDLDGTWIVHLVLSEAVMADVNFLATNCSNRSPQCPTGLLAIVVDSVVLAAPTISQGIFERDQITIGTGELREDEAKAIAVALEQGPLPRALYRVGCDEVPQPPAGIGIEKGACPGP